VNLQAKKTKISTYLLRGKKIFSVYYRVLDYLRVCSTINDLIEDLGFPHDPEEWRLRTDANETKTPVCYKVGRTVDNCCLISG